MFGIGVMSAAEVMELVRELPEREVLDLGQMLDDWAAELVDRKFENAVRAGAFDDLAAEALRETGDGRTVPLNEVLDNEHVS